MVKARIINFSLLIVSFLLLLSLLKIAIFYEKNRIYSLAQRGVPGGPTPACLYLKWETTTWPTLPFVPVTKDESFVLGQSPILIIDGKDVVIGQQPGINTLTVNGTTSVSALCLGGDCRSSWPGGGGSDLWKLFNNNGQYYLRPSSTTWRIGIGSTTPPTTTLQVFGNVMADKFLGTINASNVSAGTFGSSTGGGNFFFPAYVSIGTTTIPMGVAADSNPSLKVVGTVQANRICIGDDCYKTWPTLYTIPTKFPFYNGLLYKATTSWPTVYPVTSIDFFMRDKNYPYISFASTVDYFLRNNLINPNSTQTPWFDIAYGYHDINQPGLDKAIYVEESDNSKPVLVYHRQLTTSTCNGYTVLARNDCRDIFLGATYYDGAGILRSTSSEKFFLNNCFNSESNDGCKGVGPSSGNFLSNISTNPTGRIVLELRVVGWQRPTSSYICENKEYVPRLRLSSWNNPEDIFFRIGNYKYVSSTGDACDTALLRSKVQARFVVDPLKVLIYDPSNDTESLVIIPPSSLSAIKEKLTSSGNDFIFAFKEIGLALLAIVKR